ncbi:MAG: NAD-dependent malic enzyme, partial [Gammaproteobacteria bacterium]|nr:NAD-dependent malic enzyme [Gammaproteobacteria bacterium]
MLDFKRRIHRKTGEAYLETSIRDKPLMTTPQLNKGTAFSVQERHDFGLLGKLPPRVETLAEQTDRAYLQYQVTSDKLDRNIYLNNIHNINQVLFYNLVSKHLTEMVPTIYTPVVGQAVQAFSRQYRKARGLYLAYPERDYMEEMLDNRSNPEVDIIVVTDGEAVLGIGDQGVGGIDIPIAKLMVYTLIAGIDPNRVLPIQLDVGTDNEELLADPFYLGWRNKRVRGAEYDAFIERFVTAVKKKFPNVFLHWEDFGKNNGNKILSKYQDQLCTFNDDIQGTGAVALAAILAAIKHNKQKLIEQRIVIYGAGSAGMGITQQIYDYLLHQGYSEQEAKNCFWLIDRSGLLFGNNRTSLPEQQAFVRSKQEVSGWNIKDNRIELDEVVRQVKPTILIGCSAQAGAFTESLIKMMAEFNNHPIILPLSNPTERAEASPDDIIRWTEGRALVATGSPFEAVAYQQVSHQIAQCNNALIFPALGLGLVASRAQRCTPKMLMVAAEALAEHSPLSKKAGEPLLPDLEGARALAPEIAIAIAQEVIRSKLSPLKANIDVAELIKNHMWQPKYVPYKYRKLVKHKRRGLVR